MPNEPPSLYHQRVEHFKKWMIEATLVVHGGNRTYAARTLGLQRTYLVRLIKLFQIDVPARGRSPNNTRDC